MGRQEQIEEREVLESIYPDEITDISETSYRVSIALDVPGQDEDAEPPTINLTITYPPTYPSVPPELTLSSPLSAPKHPHLTLPADAEHLLSSLTETISSSLGEAMVFTLITTLQENAVALIQSRIDDVQAGLDEEKRVAEEAENAKFHGEAVTRESFLRWREGFRAEMEKEAEERRKAEEEGRGKREVKDEGRVTGRELWEKGLVGRVEEEEGDGEMDALHGVERLKVTE